ncbi:MAG TPA: Lrp/AsnC family transcriptional regulator [Candidatus Dormibacteraeota bacterium]|jgi:DNA-binding Lrp family transcriptional regulator|nr:Lrp/AsnC family transcriptional regulator [Candidatus Dormibacteraeota bacterium]
MSLLDGENIKILETMKQHGPRNLQQVSRKSRLPYTTVYGRVTKLQSMNALRTFVHPSFTKINLSRAMVLVKTFAGKEHLARDALKIPGYWLRIIRCIGEPNGYYSLHGIPTARQQDFRLYLDQLVTRGVIKDFQLFWLGESFAPLANFDYYDPKEKTWRFDWKEWLQGIRSGKSSEGKRAVSPADSGFDKKDLIILKELSLDARVTLADLSKLLDMTLPATKYRFDRLVKEGYVADYVITVLPFIPEVSDLCDIRLDFTNENFMRTAEKVFSKTPWVLTITPIVGLHSLAIRVYLPRQETTNLMNFLSTLAKEEVLAGYSYVQLDRSTQLSQTFAWKSYSDESGWQYDNREYLQTVNTLLSKWSKLEAEQTAPEATATIAVP